MYTLRMSGRNVALALASVLVAVSVVKAKPLLENVEIDVEVPVAGCFFPAHNRTYAVGEQWGTGPPLMCSRFSCEGPGTFSALDCAPFIAPDCIVEPGDQTAVYPDCCPWPRCPGDSDEVKPGANTPKPTDIDQLSTWEPVASNTIL